MPIRPFTDTLRELRKGRTLDELSEGLNELIRQVELTGKGGALTLVIKVVPATKGNTDQVMVADELKLKLPQPERSATLFFTTPEHNLQRNDPRQGEFKLKVSEKTQVSEKAAQA